jgi:hypothetical protein
MGNMINLRKIESKKGEKLKAKGCSTSKRGK